MKGDQIKGIEEPIIAGVNNAYYEHLRMTDNYTGFSDRIIEYHIVTCVAQALMPWASTNGIKVELEYPIRSFYNNAFPKISFHGNDIFDQKMKSRSDHNPEYNKKRRIDIALTYDDKAFAGIRALAGIEIKAINKLKASILKDVDRLAMAMQNTDSYLDNSILEGYSLFFRNLHNGKKILSDKILGEKKLKSKQDWNKEIDLLAKKFPALEFELEEISINEDTGESVEERFNPEEDNNADVAQETGLVVCYLIKIKRKP